ncbi:metallophosphoesterase family protein [Coraliomargarita algicola]|uniref:Metallophosphoesterase family protein n=1 Tax=Coraliomargarita algicola TaxID=3092156 RepID=A0ABZ0RL40_9BACT|nr:metallophosphoesterase family protein [Coraliomargarita sp. J2-16]WPJ96782.1 metallophosphoesterase family protein [Coraliomargarita sp. J2-16]
MRSRLLQVFAPLACALALHASPQHLVFTYQGDPATSLTANWQYINADIAGVNEAKIYYDTISRAGDVEAYAYSRTVMSSRIPGLEDRELYHVRLDALEAATTYYLIVGNAAQGYSEEVKIRTLPGDDSPLRFVTGGDMGTSEATRIFLRQAASHAPQFAVIGGDIAYANGNLKSVGSWDQWLQYYTEEMRTPDGLQIPLVLAIGNHEVKGSYNKPKSHAPFYFGFFAQDIERSYFSIKFSPHFALLVMDSGHIASHASQSDWLASTLESYQNIEHVAAVYHVPLYPSHRGFMDWYSREGRTHWAPLFDEFGLTVAFENHDHTFKRSHLIKNEAPTTDGTGTLYLGDGCWGREPRGIDYRQRTYLKKSGSIQHFWLVDAAPEAMKYQAIDIDNEVFDIYPSSATDVSYLAAAEAVFANKKPHYDLPSEAVKLSSMKCGATTWFSGQAQITLKNVLDFPIVADLQTFFPHDVNLKNIENYRDLSLQAGEQIELPLELTTTATEGYPRDQVNFYLRVHMRAEDPATAAEIKFEKTFGIRAKAPTESAQTN